jgi:hypothetical protein
LVALADEIATRGRWWIRIRPPGFQPARLEYEQLLPILKQSRVQLTGWDFPHLGRDEDVTAGKDFIAIETDWYYYREVVGFWQSGLFAYLLGIREDWYDRGSPTMWRPPDVTPGRLLGLADVVTTYTELFEFAARLSSQLPAENQLTVAVDLIGLQGRRLYAENPARTLSFRYTAQIDRYGWSESFRREVLLSSASDLAVQKARDLLLRFKVEFSIETLRDIQADTRKV